MNPNFLKGIVGKGYTQYFNIGDGGNREGLANKWFKNQPSWSAFRKAAYGYCRIDAFNQTHLHFSWMSNEYEKDDLYFVQGLRSPMVNKNLRLKFFLIFKNVGTS